MSRVLKVGWWLFVFVALTFVLAGCAHVSTVCETICDRYSTIPVMTVSAPIDASHCRCVGTYDKYLLRYYQNAPEAVTVTCQPNCEQVVKDKVKP